MNKKAQEIREIFDHYDRDGNGSIDRGELVKLLRALGSDADDDELAAAFEVLDADGSGDIDFDEFQAWWSQWDE